LAATFADEFNLAFRGVAETGAQFVRVRAACEQVGRDPATLGLSAAQVVCCGVDEAEIARRAASIGREVAELRTNGAAGTPDEVVERCRAFGAAGADTVYLQVLDLNDLDHIRLISESVLPHLR
jgi:alkanesulfonate monooxygenase SsuD/methylene tetrahydromethanopterin reductase-like flavin-dependent oxidoreductase (luciferase family)